MLLDVFHRLPMLSFRLSLQSGKQKKAARSQVGTLRELGNHRGVATGQKVGKDKGRVVGSKQLGNSKFFLAFHQHFRHMIRSDLAHLQIFGHYSMYHECRHV